MKDKVKKAEFKYLNLVINELNKLEWNKSTLEKLDQYFTDFCKSTNKDKLSLLRSGEVVIRETSNVGINTISDNCRDIVYNTIDCIDKVDTPVIVVTVASIIAIGLNYTSSNKGD